MKDKLWLFLSDHDHPKVTAVVPTLAWFAQSQNVRLEMYLQAKRDGRLFARHGSTVLGGRHFQQFNYLCAQFDVQVILLGNHELFASSLALWEIPILAQADSAISLYEQLGIDGERLILPDQAPLAGKPDLRPYLYPQVLFTRSLGIPESEAMPGEPVLTLTDGDDYRSVTTSLARRWIDHAEGVAFGDPDAVLSMLCDLCQRNMVTVFGKRQPLSSSQITDSAYVQEHSSACDDVRQLCEMTGNSVILGRQTCDGDLFEWSRSGIAIQIMDPNRPPFPVVRQIEHKWANHPVTVYDHEPDDEQLEQWADQGKTLSSLLVHSGEMAHNEAMLNLIDLCVMTGLKLGIGVHASRYETCPQLWELIAISQESGGASGLIEPVLHSGGMGILTENTCPMDRLAEHCHNALDRISQICGVAWKPRGYLAFMDSDMTTFTQSMPELYAMLSDQGLAYSVSCALPGRNRLLHHTDRHVTLNQSSRSICTGSPYVRVCTASDLHEKSPSPGPGWWLGVIDAPVVSFTPYIWNQGSQFMQIVRAMTSGRWINTTPHTVARYASLLAQRGMIPGA